MVLAVIFDFFDVLHTDPYKAWLAKEGLKREGAYAEASHLMDIGKISADEFLARLSKLRGRPVTADEMNERACVDPEVIDIVRELHETHRTALLSNSPSDFLRGLIARHDLARYFDEIVVSSEVGMVKPRPDIFGLALDRLGAEPSEALFIDDNPANVAAAEQLGLGGIVFTSAKQLRETLAAKGILPGVAA